jgi:pyruvate kinase
MARTKIVATIGPATNSPDAIRRLLAAGMNVARINFSHGDHESHTNTIAMLRQVAAEEDAVLAVLADLQGPKLRLGHVKAGGIYLALGDEIALTPHRGQPAMIHFPHPDVIAVIAVGARLVIGDGEVEFVVTEKKADTLRCTVTVAGLLESRKGVNAPGTDLPISSMTDKDRQDLVLACKLDLDFIALSFVRSAADVQELRRLIAENGRSIPIIAKIEKKEAIDRLSEIVQAADGMMVARGDLGIEVLPQEVPLLQKRIIQCCNNAGKPVITATQMLQSMIEHPRPTRAEASDVANAILDGTDAVMLSGETATGKFPVEAVQMMRNIAEITEQAFPYDLWRQRRQNGQNGIESVSEAISAVSCEVARQIKARAIVSTTMSGYTAQQIARHRPVTAVIAVTPSPHTQRKLALVWGVECYLTPDFRGTDTMLAQAAKAMRAYNLAPGDKLVITAGVPFGSNGATNLIQVHEIEN